MYLFFVYPSRTEVIIDSFTVDFVVLHRTGVGSLTVFTLTDCYD